jgi:hypothetical protein
MIHNYNDLYPDNEARMLQDADDAITQCNLWDWLGSYITQDGRGFMFGNNPNLDRINNAMKYQGHSGSSYAWTMRCMEAIAKDGWELFELNRKIEIQKERTKNLVGNIVTVLDQISESDPLKAAEILQDKLPNGKEQYEAMKKFSEGKLSYSEMRGLCG